MANVEGSPTYVTLLRSVLKNAIQVSERNSGTWLVALKDLDKMETDAPSVLLPCAICARTFMPGSLEKHVKICERATTKKRKPFDSAKQRIQGTDLAEFLPRQERKRSLYEEKRKSSWKETHDDFLRTIRAARGRTTDTNEQVGQSEQSGQRQSSSHASSGVPMRANEKGTCPTCNRRFGVKAYERHVAWCKERSTRLPNNFPATNNVAKERLEARMKYRAPMLKNRRTSNREKYSQGSASTPNIVTPTVKTTTPIESSRNIVPRSNLSRTRDTLSVGDARRSDKSNESQRSAVTTSGRGEPSMQASNSTEATERTNTAKRSSHLTARPKSSSRSIGLPASRTLGLPLCVSLTQKNLENEAESLGDDPVQCPLFDGDKVRSGGLEGHTIEDRKKNDVKIQAENGNNEKKVGILSSARSRKTNFARTRSESKVNDVTVNENVLGMLVRPCNLTYKDDRLITWEKISRDKVECHSFGDHNKNDTPTKNENYLSIEEETPPCELLSTPSSTESMIRNVAWSSAVRKLNRTYLIKDSVDHDTVSDGKIIDDQENTLTRHSPRVEFHVIDSTSLDHPSDSLSIDEDKCVSGIMDKIDNGDVSPFETKDILEEKNFSSHDTTSIRSESSSSSRKDSFRDDLPSKSEVDLPENVCKYENEYQDEVQTKQRDKEENEKSQELPEEEECTSSTENHIVSETCELEEKITDLEHIEIPISSPSYPSEVKNNLCNEQDALPDESQSIEVQEYSISEVSFNNTPELEEEEKPKELEDNSSFVEYPEKNDSRYDRDYIDRLDITFEEACESVGETNAKDLVDRDKDSVKENRSEIIEVDDIKDNIEETQYIAISDPRVKLERPLPIPIPIHRLHLIRIDSKIQKNMNLLRGSTDTLISSVEAIDLTNGKRSNELHRNSSEEDKMDDPYRRNRSEKARILPAIKVDRTDTTYFRERSPKNSGQNYWEKATKLSNDRSNDNLLQHDYRHNRLRKRNPKIRILPPVLIDHSPRMKSGGCKDYDPFLLAERQMHDLLLSDSSDLSMTVVEETLSDRARKGSTKRRESLYPLSHSSAFVDYPSHDKISSVGLDKRSSIEATSTGGGELDELASDFSSDSTETNSLSREIFLRDFHDSKERDRQKEDSPNSRTRAESSKRELGRRMILDKSIVLGNEAAQEGRSNRNERRLGDLKPKPSKVLRSIPNRSQPIRAYSAPKSIYGKSKTTDGGRDGETLNVEKRDRANTSILDNDRKNDYITLSGSDLSLSSIVSSEVDIKRSNSVFDELITSFEDEVLGNDSFPSLRSLLRNESLRAYDNSPVHGPGIRQHHDDRISDEEYSSPENYKQQEQKFNADSAYSSLNRKSNYSNHGRSTNDGPNRFEDNSSRNNRRENQTTSISAGKTKCRMSRFCHECGSKFPETAKFCCQCGVKRLTL